MNLLVAEAITTSGQLSIRWIEKYLNQYLNKILGTDNKDYVLASDTDSVYITFDELVNKSFGTERLASENESGLQRERVVRFLDRLAREKIEPFIDKSYQSLAEYVSAYDQKMSMKREVIADKGIWTAQEKIYSQCMGYRRCQVQRTTTQDYGFGSGQVIYACTLQTKD